MRATARCPLLALLLLASTACDQPPCSEPLPSGGGAVGAECVTIRDCREGLACIGRSFEADATCSDAAELPGGADPGCLEHAGDWAQHESDGVRPISFDEEGCELLVFESACNCTGGIGDGGCLPTFPLYRMEIWRSCDRCCWRLVAFWEDGEACGDP
jgi:hypothetical protein